MDSEEVVQGGKINGQAKIFATHEASDVETGLKLLEALFRVQSERLGCWHKFRNR